jgi:hypothetical protein
VCACCGCPAGRGAVSSQVLAGNGKGAACARACVCLYSCARHAPITTPAPLPPPHALYRLL